MDTIERWVTTWESLALDCSWDMRRSVWLFLSKPHGFQERLQGLPDDFGDDERLMRPDLIHARALPLAMDSLGERDTATLRRWVETVCVGDASDRLDESDAFRAAALLAGRYAEMVEDPDLRGILSAVLCRWRQLTDGIFDGLDASMSAVLENEWQRDRVAKKEAWTLGEEEVGGHIEGLTQFNSFVEAVDEVLPQLTDKHIHELVELQPRVLLKAFGSSNETVIAWPELVERHRFFLDLIPEEQG